MYLAAEHAKRSTITDRAQAVKAIKQLADAPIEPLWRIQSPNG